MIIKIFAKTDIPFTLQGIRQGPLSESDCSSYVGHPISSANGLVSQKLLLKSEFYNPLHVALSVAYSCLKY